MSGTALGWVKRVKAPCSQSRGLLRVLADYADADGFAWPAIATMADEMQLSERMVKRYLRALELAGLVVGFDVIDRATGRTRTSAYWFPVFADAPNERLVQAYERKVGGRVQRHDVPVAELGEGVTHDTLQGVADDMGEGVTHDTPRVSPMTPLEPSLEPAGPNGPTQRERVLEASPFDQVFAAWAAVAPGRLARPKVVGPWAVEAAAAGGDEALARYALRYLAEDPDVQRGLCLSLDRWLTERRWEAWMVAPSVVAQLVAAARTPFAGPAGLREALAAAAGEAKVRSYLDPSSWRAGDGIIETRTGTARDWLRAREFAGLLDRFGVQGVERVRGEA